MNTAPRRALLLAALAAVRVKTQAPEFAILHAWLDSWSGLGLIVVGMQRHGYDLFLTHDRNGWRATFLHRSHVLRPCVGQVLHWWPTPRRAVQEAASPATASPTLTVNGKSAAGRKGCTAARPNASERPRSAIILRSYRAPPLPPSRGLTTIKT